MTFPTCPPGAPGLPDTCVKVDVFRNQARGNALPTFFGRVADVMDQGVRATATAQIATGDTTDCLRPWAIVDRWNEFGPEGPTPGPLSTYDKYSDGRGQQSAAGERRLYAAQRIGSRHGLQSATGHRGPVCREDRCVGKPCLVRVVQDDRSSTPRHDTLGNNTVQSNIMTLQRSAIELRRPDHRVPDRHREQLGDDGVLGGAGLLSRADRRDGRLDEEHGSGPDGPRRRSELGATARAIVGSCLQTRRAAVRASSRSASWTSTYTVATTQRDRTACAHGQHLRLLHRGHGRCRQEHGAIIIPANNGQSIIGRIMTIPATAVGSSSLPNTASFLRTIFLSVDSRIHVSVTVICRGFAGSAAGRSPADVWVGEQHLLDSGLQRARGPAGLAAGRPGARSAPGSPVAIGARHVHAPASGHECAAGRVEPRSRADARRRCAPE